MTTSAEAPLTLQDLEQSGYEIFLALDTEGWYVGMADELLKAAIAAESAGNAVCCRAYSFLYSICSMLLDPSDQRMPLRPAERHVDGSTTMHPDVLSKEEIALLADFAGGVTHSLLRARIADIVWLKERRRGIAFAHMAIEAYCARSIDPERWFLSDKECWQRALQLAQSITDVARIAAIESSLLSAFRAVVTSPDREPLIYLAPLYAQRCCIDKAEEIGTSLANLGDMRLAVARFHDAQEIFGEAGRWFLRANRKDLYAAMLVQEAKAMTARGDSDPSGIGQRHWYDKAIETYRMVPRAYREEHDVDVVLHMLRAKLTEAGGRALGEMSTIEHPIDLTDTAAWAVKRVRGREPLEALYVFSLLHKLPNRERILKYAEEVVDAGHIRHMAATTVLDFDGRAIGKREAIGARGEGREAHVNAEAIKNCFNVCGMTVTGLVLPALQAMQEEFNLTYMNFLELTRLAPLVPRDRAELVAQGLHAGWCRDYVQAVHILTPQFEHMVRMALKVAGVHTTTRDSEGLDTEIGLSNLIRREEMVREFGEDLTFTIRSLMCEQEGPNVRNAIAHGLAGRSLCEGPYGVYTWWLVLRLIVCQYVAMTRESMVAESPNSNLRSRSTG